MGLFDFVDEIGAKLFDNKENAAEKIQSIIEAENLAIERLGVKYNDGEVSLIGISDDKAAIEKAILIAGNIQGVTKVIPEFYLPKKAETDEGYQPLNLEDTSDEVDYYVIQAGDTLSKLAKRYYNDASRYPRIFEANREVIKDPDKIYVGQKIRIPLGNS
ncbi:MAG: peptidoglycan-binding protein LysM [Pseudomonadota bacterium]